MDIKEINEEINGLESAETNWGNVQRLALLYTVREHLPQTTGEVDVEEIKSTDEFTQACCGVNINSLINVLDEHMQVIHAVYPKEYSALIKKIQSLKADS